MSEIQKKYQIGVRRFGLVNWVGAYNLYVKEVNRFFIVWAQTLLSPLISSLLFLSVLSLAIGNERGEVLGFPLISFLAPGLIGNQDAYELATHFGKIIFPYLLFIALVAQFSSITNAYNKFAFGAFAPSLLNISLIGSLLFFSPYLSTPGHSLSYGVILGGIFQFILMYYALTKLNIRPFFVLPKINDNIKKFLKF